MMPTAATSPQAAVNGYVRRGGREVDEEEERADYYVRELRHGSFRRSMLLAEGV
jgi:HSP20 family molecular chaperone IbpA